jgi:acetyl esterase/lipase
MRFRLVASLLLFPLSLLAGCSGAQLVNAITPRGGYSVARDIPFGDQGLKLDVYSPEHAEHAPVVVFFYGGSWQSKISLDRSAYKFVGQALTQEGYVAVIADYRLYPQVKYPQFLGDCAQAVAWAHAHAAEYGGDPARLVLMGHSAGAYNAVMLALQPSYLQAAGADRAWVRGVVGLAGPYDFLPIVDPDLKEVFGPEEQWPQTQPIAYVDGHAPPLLLMAGDNDTVVYVKNTNNLYQRVHDSGGQAEKVTYRSMGHVRIIALLSSRLPGHGELMGHISGFVRQVTGDAAMTQAATP